MFAMNISPSRAAPPLQVDAHTAEKNTSPSFSEGEPSPHPPTTAATVSSASETTFVSPAKTTRSHRTHTTFTRTNLAASSAATASPEAATQTSIAGSTSALVSSESASPARTAPSPVRSILDFYLGASPSPHRPELDAAGEAYDAVQENHSVRSAPSSPAASTESESFRRSPAPARTYMEEFLAADDDADDDACRLRAVSLNTREQKESVREVSPASDKKQYDRHVVGVAMDNSPVVAAMWDETSSSASFVSSERTTSPAPPLATHLERNNRQPWKSPVEILRGTRPPAGTALATLHSVDEDSAAHAWRRQPVVERELRFPASTADMYDATAKESRPVSLLTPSFTSWRGPTVIEAHTQSTPPPNEGKSEGNGSSDISLFECTQPCLAPPVTTAPRRRSPLRQQRTDVREAPNTTSPTVTALSSLLRLQKTQTSTQDVRVASAEHALRRMMHVTPFSTDARAAATFSRDEKYYVKAVVPERALTPRGTQPPHCNNGQIPLSHACGTRSVSLHEDPADAARGPVAHRQRGVVARLYPARLRSSRLASQDPSTSMEAKNTIPAHAVEDARSAAVPRWNASTRILYNCVTESIEAPVTPDGRLHRNRSCNGTDYVAERPSSRTRLRSASARSSLTPPLQTRTTLLRLQVTSARKTEEAAKLEEDLHPTFHPELAPNSARICREKLRELTASSTRSGSAAAHKEEKKEPTPCSVSVAARASTSSIAAKEKRTLCSASKLARDRSQQREKGTPRGQPVSARSTVRNVDRFQVEAVHRSKRQSQEQPQPQPLAMVAPVQPKKDPPGHITSAEHEPKRGEQLADINSQPASVHRSTPGGGDAMVSGTSHALNHAGEGVLPRVDLYTSMEPNTNVTGSEDLQQQSQRVEERLLALEEDRRRRLYLMRHYADTRDAATGQRLFKPFTGR